MSKVVLLKEYKDLTKEKWVEIEIDEEDIYTWNLALMVLHPDSMYYGGYFNAVMTFPKDYPYRPPDFRFKRPIFHPNVYDDGRLCISILHAPGEDVMSGESAGERWSPAQRVESVLISILSLLDDPEILSPANIEASNMYRDDKKMFKERVKENVERSKADMPEGFVMPRHETTKPVVEKIEDDFWADSDAEDAFGGSDSDAEMTMDDDFDEDDVEEEHDHEDDQD